MNTLKRHLSLLVVLALLSPASSRGAISTDDVLVRCAPSPTRSSYLNGAFGGYQIEFKLRDANDFGQQVRLMNDLPYDLDFSNTPFSKKTFDQAFTSRVLNKNLTASDTDPQGDAFRKQLTAQETALLETNPLVINAVHFVNLHATINHEPVTRKSRHKTAEWILDKGYLADSNVEQRHSALFQGPTYLIPLVGIAANADQKSSTLIINAVGYIGIGLGIALIRQVIYHRHWEKGVQEALNYDGDFHVDPVSQNRQADAYGYVNYRASVLVLGAGNKPIVDFRYLPAGSTLPLRMHYALACDGSYELPKSGEPLPAFREFLKTEPH